MGRNIEQTRFMATTAGGTSTAYGTVYGSGPVVGKVVRMAWSGAGLGGSGFFTVGESGTNITGALIGGSALDAGEMDWNDSVVPMIKCKDGTDMTVELMEGSAFYPYYTNAVPLLTISGCNAGTLTMDVYWKVD